MNYDNESNWNYLFLNPNAVTNAFSKKNGIEKGAILNKDDGNLAVRVG
jgi:hypothetical protein